MKKPSWVNIVGVLGIIFGLFGLIGSVQTASMPIILNLQKEMMGNFEKIAQTKPENAAEFQQFKNTMENFIGDIPKWFSPVSVAIGIIGIIVNAFYIYAAILLLQVNPKGITYFYAAIAMSIGVVVIRSLMAGLAFSKFGITSMLGGIVGLVLDLILLAVVATGNKDAFELKTGDVV